MVKQSIMMEKLYGAKLAKIVYARCQEIGADFNERVQTFVYDGIWAGNEFELKERSLVTVLALIVANKAEQLKIHLWRFFYQGGSIEDIEAVLIYMQQAGYINNAEQVHSVLETAQNVYLTYESNIELGRNISLEEDCRFKAVSDLVACTVNGDNEKIAVCIESLLLHKVLSSNDKSYYAAASCLSWISG